MVAFFILKNKILKIKTIKICKLKKKIYICIS